MRRKALIIVSEPARKAETSLRSKKRPGGCRFEKYWRSSPIRRGWKFGHGARTISWSTTFSSARQNFTPDLFEEKRAKKALDYLISRGVRKEDIADWQLGFAPADNSLREVLAKRGWEKQGAALGVLGEKNGRYYDFFYGRIIFPIRDARGRVLGFGGRILGEGGPKYINSRETSFFRKREIMYGLDRARAAVSEKGEALISEGYLDCILLHAHGFTNAIAPLGTALTLSGISYLLRYGDAIYVFDGDAAGRKAAQRASLFSIGLSRECYVSFLPEGEDPASLMASGKKGCFRDITR